MEGIRSLFISRSSTKAGKVRWYVWDKQDLRVDLMHARKPEVRDSKERFNVKII